MRVLVPLAEGFEEIEAITIIDILRRASIDVTTIHPGKQNPVTGSHNIPVKADKHLKEIDIVDYNILVLPGGMPGSENLKNDDKIISFIKHIYSRGGYIAALCAAPIALERAEIIFGKKITCFPGFEKHIRDIDYTGEPVSVDGKIITGKGPGCAIPFTLEIVRILKGDDAMTELKETMQVYWM